MRKRRPSILLAFGGHVLEIKEGEFSRSRRMDHPVASQCMRAVAELLKMGYERIIMTHGNGPQVGKLLMQQHLLRNRFPEQPIDVCVADTQGRIGYVFQRVFDNLCVRMKLNKKTSAVITQVVVDSKDPAFKNPTKPVGVFYSQREAIELRRKTGWTIKNEPGRGYRRVVPSPEPKEIVEKALFRELLKRKFIPIGAGGGGIPVVRDRNGQLRGVEAVIDKDKTSALLANLVNIHTFVILTEVPHAYLHFRTSKETPIRSVTVRELKRMIRENHFHEGSMLPKIEAALRFIERGGRRAIITSIDVLFDALEGRAGTHVVPG